MKKMCLIVFLFFTVRASYAFNDTIVQGFTFKNLTQKNALKKYELFEIGIALPTPIVDEINTFIKSKGNKGLNPFISTNIRIQLQFELEDSSMSVTRDAFFTRDFERDVSRFEELYQKPSPSTGHNSHWKKFEEKYSLLGGKWEPKSTSFPFRVRFAPPKAGKWKVKAIISLEGFSTQFNLPSIEVKESNHPGYVEVDKYQRFLKRGGKTQHVIGENYPMPVLFGYPLFSPNGNKIITQPQYYSETAPIAVYEQYLRYMDTLKIRGMNYFRMLMTPWSTDIEYEKLGNYYDRLHIAHELDQILVRAEKNELLINWNLTIHYPFTYKPYHIIFWDWSSETGGNGYCYSNELNLENVIDFFTDERAKFYWKERLRYIVARWGYSPQIAMFEQFSEIDQFGNGKPELADSLLYKQNASTIVEWHAEMNHYLKQELQVPQLLTVSYTSGFNETIDSSWADPNVDVINYNNYNYFQSEIHDFYKRLIPKDITNKGQNLNRGNYNKPMFYSETGPHEVWSCDNEVEQRRMVWQAQFYGIAGALSWNPIADTVLYQAISQFKDTLDLETDQWHSGMVKLDKEGNWVYKDRFVRSMVREDQTADLIYMRSRSRKQAMGVLTNRRYNYYTKGEGDCVKNYPKPEHTEGNGFATERLQTYGPTVAGKGQNKLKVRGMLGKKYRITYYNANNPAVPIYSEETRGRQLTLNYPVLGGENDDILLFKVLLID